MAQIADKSKILLLAVAGYSGSGKTVLIEKLLPVLKARGLEVATIKHSHHDIELDTPGKDSFRHRQAGAAEVVLVCNKRWMLIHERPTADNNISPLELLPRLSRHIDMVIVEGFKLSAINKIEVWRGNLNRQPLYLTDPSVKAVATSAQLPRVNEADIVQLDLMNPVGITDWILTNHQLFSYQRE